MVIAVGLGIPYLHWFADGLSSAALAAVRVVTVTLFVVWFVGRPLAVTVADRWQRRSRVVAPSDEGISIIVPCHNASPNVRGLVRSILAQDYRPIEILLVENNSTDATFDLLLELERDHDEVRAFWIPPKPDEYAASVALNVAVERARYPVILRIDDDTILAPGAITDAMRALADEDTSAVACNLRVRNPDDSIWTRVQSIEYLLAMELDRRSQALVESVLVCSGGMQVFRRDVILAHDGYVALPRVVSEDFDMTLKAHRQGYVATAPGAIGFTEVPATFRALAKQRFRWAICGTVSLWLHRKGICNPRYWFGGMVGFLGLPMRVAMFARDVLPFAFIIDVFALVRGQLWWFLLLIAARAALLGVQLVLLSPALRCRQGLSNALVIPFFSLVYGPLLLCVRFAGTLAGVKHIYEQRVKLRGLELAADLDDDVVVLPAATADVLG